MSANQVACLNAQSQYQFSTFDAATTNAGCTQAHMDAMIPYFNACSLSVVSDSFFGFSSGSNYYVSPADMQWYCYTKYGLLLTGTGLPATPPATEPAAPVPISASQSSSAGLIAGIVIGLLAVAGLGYYFYARNKANAAKAAGLEDGVAFADVAAKPGQQVFASGQSVYSHT
ncbi:hypothetical protein HDU98_011869 [Podochytrium sp. JEL0797]|nr:hypothetical protein HDU98_011869 [Podochytrium sp. JEL0797]